MRTVGTFQEIYTQARKYELAIDDGAPLDDRPMDPEVRYDGDNWMIESALSSAEDAIALCKLEVFDTYFWEAYKDPAFTPSDTDEKDFIFLISEE